MTLHQSLAAANSEEDVKDAYVKAIGLKGVTKGRVDIQAPNMWFEAKEAATPAMGMIASGIDVRNFFAALSSCDTKII